MMRTIVLSILLACLPLGVCFAQTELPSIGMQSVNNSAVMSSGSVYSSSTYEVGASGVRASVPANGPRKELVSPTTGGTGNQPGITTPVGNAIIPLLIFSIAFIAYKQIKKYRNKAFFNN